MPKLQLPQNTPRIVADFTDLPDGDKQRVVAHLESQPDQNALNKVVDQIIHNGGAEAELVGRIFNRPVNPAEGKDQPERPGIRTVHNKPLEPIQKKDAGSGQAGAGHLATEEPHTSTANPPAHGHPGRTVAQPGDNRDSAPSLGENADVQEGGEVRPKGKVTEGNESRTTPSPTSTRPASGRGE